MEKNSSLPFASTENSLVSKLGNVIKLEVIIVTVLYFFLGSFSFGGVTNWATRFDMYTLMWIKLMTNKNLLYKKIK